jgi:hypothetical protein
MFYKNMELEGISEGIRSPIHSPRKRFLEDAEKYETFTRDEEVKQKRRRLNASEALAMLNSPVVSPVGSPRAYGPPQGFSDEDNTSSDDPMDDPERRPEETMDVASEKPALD